MSDLERLSGPDSRIGLGWIPIIAAVLLAVGLVLTWPDQNLRGDTELLGLADELHRAEVTRVIDGPCSFNRADDCRTVEFTLEEGPRAGTDFVQEFTSTASTPELAPGDAVFLAWVPGGEPGFDYQYSDRDRRGVLVAVFLAFTVAVAALGRLRGIAALAGLILSVVVVVGYRSEAVEERVSVETAMRAYTVNNAWAAGEEDLKGALRPGLLADIVVLDRDPFTIPPEQLKDVRVLVTIVGGRVVHEARPST